MSKIFSKFSKEVKEICEPYFKQLELDHFNYIHRDHKGNVAYLCSNPKWINHYLDKSYPNIGAFEQNIAFSKYNYILWNGLDRNDPILIDSKEMLGVEFGITIIKHEYDGIGFYNLGTKSSNSSIINQYINKLDKYENFILSFQEKAHQILLKTKELKLSIIQKSLIDHRKKIAYPFKNTYFTDRELECINYLILGKTAEEISMIFDISKRTVETHIVNIKRKMNCFNQVRLGYLLGQMGITHNLI